MIVTQLTLRRTRVTGSFRSRFCYFGVVDESELYCAEQCVNGRKSDAGPQSDCVNECGCYTDFWFSSTLPMFGGSASDLTCHKLSESANERLGVLSFLEEHMLRFVHFPDSQMLILLRLAGLCDRSDS